MKRIPRRIFTEELKREVNASSIFILADRT
jgi:hypothetical protein